MRIPARMLKLSELLELIAMMFVETTLRKSDNEGVISNKEEQKVFEPLATFHPIIKNV